MGEENEEVRDKLNQSWARATGYSVRKELEAVDPGCAEKRWPCSCCASCSFWLSARDNRFLHIGFMLLGTLRNGVQKANLEHLVMEDVEH